MNMVAATNSIAIGSGLVLANDHELAIGGFVAREIRVIMTPEEHRVIAGLLDRATFGPVRSGRQPRHPSLEPTTTELCLAKP